MSKRTSSDFSDNTAKNVTKKRKSADHSSTFDFLPDPSMRKKVRGDAKKAFSLLQEIDFLSSSISTRMSMDQVLCLLIAKFGWHAISTIASLINSLPKVLTEKQFSSILECKCAERGVVLTHQRN